jgi:hypothetical protein
MLFKKVIDVYSENHTKHINTLFGKRAELWVVKAGSSMHIITIIL